MAKKTRAIGSPARVAAKFGKGEDPSVKDFGKGADSSVKDFGKGEDPSVKDFGKGLDNAVKDFGKGEMPPAAVAGLLQVLSSGLEGWLVVSFIAPVRSSAPRAGHDNGNGQVDFAALRQRAQQREQQDAKRLQEIVQAQGKSVHALRTEVHNMTTAIRGTLTKP